MADVDASGASPSIADPLPAASGFNATDFLRKYWWEIGLVILVIAFLVYTYWNNSKAQVGNASTTASGDPNATTGTSQMTQDANEWNLKNLSDKIDQLLSTENSEASKCPPGQHWVAAVTPGPGMRMASTMGHCAPDGSGTVLQRNPGPRWYGPKQKFPEHVKEYAKLHPGAPAPVYGGMGGAMGHGGPPAWGPKVPFGTHIGLHDPLEGSGNMYANVR